MSQNNKKTLIIPNKKKLNFYKEFNSFILPLKGFSVGFEEYFTEKEINNYSSIYDIYVIINKFMFKEDLEKIKKIKFINVKKIFVEDLSLIEFFGREKIVFYPIHLINNFEYVNYLEKININSCVISNDLTITELKKISTKTKIDLYYFYISKNQLMYSKRKLVSNYNQYNNTKFKKEIIVQESVSNLSLIMNEEEESSTFFYDKIFCASKYFNQLSNNYNLIINLSFLSNEEIKYIFKYYKSNDLNDFINSDYYFLENEIKYKVGDLK